VCLMCDIHSIGLTAVAKQAHGIRSSLLLKELDKVESQPQYDADEDNIQAEVSAGPHLQQMTKSLSAHHRASQKMLLPLPNVCKTM